MKNIQVDDGLNVLVIGAGMYVCGRGTDGYGTIMPAIFEWGKRNRLGNIFIAGSTFKGVMLGKMKIKELAQAMGVSADIRYFPGERKDNPLSYLDAIRRIPKPACAVVVVPDNLHRDVAQAAVAGGLHTLVVKPLSNTLKETQELIRLQQKNKVYCAVEFHKRLDRANIKLQDAIRENLIGDPLYFLIEYSQRKSIPAKFFKNWVGATNVFQYLGVHYVDIIYFVTGATPIRVMAVGQKNWLLSKGIDTYDSIEGVIEWKMPSGKKFISHILTNWIDPESTSAMSDQKIKIIGTKGRFESNQKYRGITVVDDKNGIEEPNPYFCAPYGRQSDISYAGYGVDSLHQFLKDVVQIENGELKIKDLDGKRPTFKESIVPTAVLEAVNRSLKNNGAWVRIRSGASKSLK